MSTHRKRSRENEAERTHQKLGKRRIGQSASSIRRTRALQIVFGEQPIIHVGGPIWDVPSETKGAVRYAVNMDRLTCSCPFWRDKRVICKHIEAVRIHKARSAVKVETADCGLPNAYKNPPYYDRLAERQFHILTLLLASLGKAVAAKTGGSDVR